MGWVLSADGMGAALLLDGEFFLNSLQMGWVRSADGMGAALLLDEEPLHK